ncbi:MAG: diacylglycerol kinase family lipid kinase [Chloroflexi bacterium]|nr:diacylglycerol kinase family lipid kinase [Chloroflexota bacterium]
MTLHSGSERAPDQSGRRATVILNPMAPAASKFRARWADVQRTFRDFGWDADLLETKGPGDATTLAHRAADRATDLVVAAGGDGTLNEIVNGLAHTPAALGVIPVGTTNVWVRELGLPLRPLAALRTLLAGSVHQIDLGRAGDRFFLLMAGVGFDGYVMRAVTPQTKRTFGIAAYLYAGFVTALTFRSVSADVYCDGRLTTVSPLHLAVIGNTRRYATVAITSEAYCDDGLLDLCLFAGQHAFLSRTLHVLDVLTRRHTRSKFVLYERASEVRIETSRPLPVQLDGDFVGFTPMDFAAVPKALRVLLPAAPLPMLRLVPVDQATAGPSL